MTSENQQLFTAGDCPVCADTGSLLYLRRADEELYFYFCPTCGNAYLRRPRLYVVDEVNALASVAPNGVQIPEAEVSRRIPGLRPENAAWMRDLQFEIEETYSSTGSRKRGLVSSATSGYSRALKGQMPPPNLVDVVREILAGCIELDVETVPICPDLAWDADMTEQELLGAEPAAVVSTSTSPSTATFQRFRREIRYMLLPQPHSGPVAMEYEIGTVESIHGVRALCDEYLIKHLSLHGMSAHRIVSYRGTV